MSAPTTPATDPARKAMRSTHVIAVASGKGGTGKTTVALNLALALAGRGRRVCLLDADLGLSNADLLLGVRPEKTLEDVLFGGLPMDLAVTAVRPNLDLVAGSSGVARLAELDAPGRARLTAEFAKLGAYDYLLVDNAPGISALVVSLCLGCEELVVVLNPEVASVTDAYALIKVLKENGLVRPPLLVVNRCKGEAQARAVSARFGETTRRFLGLPSVFLGAVPEDSGVSRAAALRVPLVEAEPESPAARAVQAAAGDLEAYLQGGGPAGEATEAFFERAAQGLAKGARLLTRALGGAAAPAEDLDPEVRTLDVAVERLAGRPEAAALAGEVAELRLAVEALRRRLGAEPPQAAGDSLPEAPAAPPRPQAVVLCADLQLLEVLAELAADAGYEIKGAVSGPALAERLSRRLMDEAGLLLVAADAAEPDEDALERLLAAAGNTPVVLIEGFAGRSAAARRHADRLAAVLARPFRVEDLLSVLERLASGGRRGPRQ